MSDQTTTAAPDQPDPDRTGHTDGWWAARTRRRHKKRTGKKQTVRTGLLARYRARVAHWLADRRLARASAAFDRAAARATAERTTLARYPRPTPADQPAPDTDRPARSGARYRIEETYALLILAAPLVVAGWFQAHAAHHLIDLPWPLAIAFTAAWEGAAGYCAILYHRTLVAGDSTLMLRLGMLTYAAGSCGLLWWELSSQGRPPILAAAVGALTTSAIYLWSRRARWQRRDTLRERGLVDAQVVRFSVASWIAAPVETPRALRYAIKHRITSPRTAIEAYRADRQRRRTGRALARMRSARRALVRSGGHTGTPPATHHRTASQTGTQTTTVAAPVRQTTGRVVRPAPAVRAEHTAAAANARLLDRRYPDHMPGPRQVRRDMQWGGERTKAALIELARMRAGKDQS